MANWTDIPDAVLEIGQPIRSIDAKALRDNPRAIAEGASGAPKIDPINAMAHGGQVGAIGTYAFLRPDNNIAYQAGDTLSGASLRFSGAMAQTSAATTSVEDGGTPSGTWRCMGNREGAVGTGNFRVSTLWLRIN